MTPDRESNSQTPLKLTLLPGRLAVCRLDEAGPIEVRPAGGVFWSLTVARGERSLVCAEDQAPKGAVIEAGWRLLGVEGPLALTQTGVLAALSGLLASAGVPVFVVSTYDTDYLLIKEAHLSAAVGCLREGGHKVALESTEGMQP